MELDFTYSNNYFIFGIYCEMHVRDNFVFFQLRAAFSTFRNAADKK